MARQPAGSPVLRALLDEYEYDGLETCAADGSCMLACPLGIDTGKLVKELRARQHGPRAERIALAAARRWAAVERAARAGLRAGAPLRGATRALRNVISSELVPDWPAEMPRPAPARLPITTRDGAAAVYLPACINRIFGNVARFGPGNRPARGAGHGFGPRGAARLDPAGRGRALLRHAVELEGLPGGRGVHGDQDARRAVGLVG